jgi:photosystem II stability/assembly factor-like uncharacterized protein
MNQSLYSSLPKVLLFTCFLLFFEANAQVNTFETVANEINIPTQPYSSIKKGADSLFAYWHAQNPNDTGLAPGEKKFIRWNALAQSRGHIAGDNTTSVSGIQSTMTNIYGSIPYCSTGLVNHEWQLIGPNPEPGDKMVYGIANTIAVHPTNSNIIYAGTQEGGLFKSIDGGLNWTNVTDNLNLSGLGVVSIAIDPNNTNTVLIGTYSQSFGYTGWHSYSSQGYGILKSTDGGLNWSTTSLTPSKQEGHISIIRFDSQNSNIVFAAGSTGIFKSTNNGSTWTEVFTTSTDPSLEHTHFIDIEISSNSNTICASTLKTGGHNITEKAARIFCSNNGGASFSDCTPAKAFQYNTLPNGSIQYTRAAHSIALDVTPDDPNNIYAFFATKQDNNTSTTSTSATLVKTSNGGQSWLEVFDQTNSTAYNVVSIGNGHWGRWRYQFELSDYNADKVYIGGDKLMFFETGVSSSWSALTDYWPTQSGHADIRWIQNYGVINGEDNLYIANDGGLAHTINSGSSWTNLNGNGFSVSQIHGFASWPGNEHYVLGAMHNLQHSIGNGVKYLARHAPGGDGAYAISEPGNDEYFYMNSNGGLYRCKRLPSGNIVANNSIQGHTELKAKFDAIDDNGVKLFYSSNGKIKVYTPSNNSSSFVFNSANGEEFSVIKVSPSNPNVIYAARFDACWGCTANNGNVANKFWKRDNNGTWVDLSPNITMNGSSYQYLAATYITDIAVDPYNENRVWVGVAYYSPNTDQNRVFYSSDGGLTWQDQSKGLPPYPVNCLTYQKGSNDIIYAGTDGGVYYFDKSADNGNGAWQCFNNNLPPAIIAKIDVQPCRNKVIASTYGRALWEVPMIQSTTTQEIISSTTSWGNGTRNYTADLVVDNGATLTITGTVEFSSNSSLIIKPGGKVILDGGHLTADGACGNTNYSWRGVKVLGTTSQNQSPLTHGVLVIKNNGTISHARTAITNAGWTGYDFDWGTQGGIIWAKNAVFLNNRRDLQFISYHNNHIGNVEWNYKARFTNCSFIRNNQYAMEAPANAVTLWDVKGISFLGCSFENNTNYPYSGNGIYALTAQIRVSDLTNPTGSDRSEFSGYDYAIHSSNVFSIDRYTTIKNSDFENNRHAVYLSAHSNTEFVNNSFDIPDITTPIGLAGIYGSYFDACTGFEFTKNSYFSQSNNHPKVGAIWKNTGEIPNLVYKNSFDNLSCGAEAIGNNKGPGLQGGLVFKCNNFGDDNVNNIDIGVWKENNSLLPQGIAASQGEWNGSSSQSSQLANNLFSNNAQDIYNESGNYIFSYHYGSGNSRFAPYQAYNINEQSHSVAVSYNTDCPDLITGHTSSALHQSLSTQEASISVKRGQYLQLLNGGDTQELEAEILLANQQDLQALYLELLSISPYVEDRQLIELINKNGFSELALRNVLVANPHSARNPDVMTALMERSPAVSQLTINDVRLGQQTITTKDILESDIASIELDVNRIILGLQRFYSDSTSYSTDSLISLYDRDEPHLIFALAEHYAINGQYTNLSNVLTGASTDYWSESELYDLNEFISFYSTLQGQINDGEYPYGIDQLSLDALSNTMNNTNSELLWNKIYSLLEFYNQNDINYIEPVYYTGATAKKENSKVSATLPISTFKVYPNPATEYIQLQWNWFEEGLNDVFKVKVYNMNGAIVKSIEDVDFQKNTHFINLDQLHSGVFIIEVTNNEGIIIHTESITINK